MAEKKLDDLPPAYTNLGYDDESGAGPSAPPIFSESSSQNVQRDIIHPSAPPQAILPSHESSLGPPPMVYNPPSLVFEDIYDACVIYVKKHCCYGSRFINRMKLTEIINKGVYHYKLESFGEKRASTERYMAYRGGPVDGPDRGRPPDPWEMSVSPSELFKDAKTEKFIPHTDYVRTCFRCDGSGKESCWRCSGSGQDSCSRCSGRGRDSEDERCSSCSGTGRETCSTCYGSGEVECSKCSGYGKLLYYKVLIVNWKNHISNFVSNTDDMPRELFLKAEGVTLFENQDFTVLPIINAPDQSVNVASISLLEEHKNSFPNEMIIRQRHILRACPCTRVKYTWKEKEGEFYVYGTDRQVYFEDYPQKCCCCTCC